MTRQIQARSQYHGQGSERPLAGREAGLTARASVQPSGAADGALLAVIAGCFLPVGLLVIAVSGGGAVAVAIGFAAEVLITAILVVMIARAIDQQPGGGNLERDTAATAEPISAASALHARAHGLR